MAKYVLRDGKFVCKETGEDLVSKEDKLRFQDELERGLSPMITSDIPDYLSPVTGKLVSGRRARKEDLVSNGCYEIDPPSKSLRERQKPKDTSLKIEADSQIHAELETIATDRGLK